MVACMNKQENTSAWLEKLTLPALCKGPLNDLTFAVKETIDIKGLSPSNGVPLWQKTHPKAKVHAKIVQDLLEKGATCLGRARCAELTFSIDGESPLYGTPLNPKLPKRLPGGSSSGSASLVGAGAVDFSIGTDNTGSVRVPASYCGIYGMRPSPSFFSTKGLVPFAPSFDTVGVFASSISNLYKVGCSFLANKPETKKQTLYLIKECFSLSDPSVERALRPVIKKIRDFFAVQELSLEEVLGPNFLPLEKWYDDMIRHIQWEEVLQNTWSWVETLSPRLSPRIEESLIAARNLSINEEGKELLFSYRGKLQKALSNGGLFVFPTTPSTAPMKGTLQRPSVAKKYYGRTLGICALASVGELPEISLPLASFRGAPIALSLLGGKGLDGSLLDYCFKISTLPLSRS